MARTERTGQMEGRWTITWHMGYEGRVSESVAGERPTWTEGPSAASLGTARVIVPVVPCDDAAVERVAQMIVERALGGFDDEDGVAWAALNESDRDEWREEARELLRAAGATT